MSLLNSIKNTIGNYLLAQDARQLRRQKAFINLEQARSVGIVFDATDPEQFDLVKKYVSYLKDMKKKVKAIGFFNKKELPPLTYSKLEYDFFTLKELNWYNFPESLYVKNFIADEHDMLLDLNLMDEFPLRCVSTLSKARFKIGKRSDRNSSIFDMMIETDGTKGLKFFLRNVDEYILKINKTQEKTSSSHGPN